MCTWTSETTPITARARGSANWIAVTCANVCYDHPVRLPLGHALILDFVDEQAGPDARVAVELSATSARELLRTIEAALASQQAQLDLAAAEAAP